MNLFHHVVVQALSLLSVIGMTYTIYYFSSVEDLPSSFPPQKDTISHISFTENINTVDKTKYTSITLKISCNKLTKELVDKVIYFFEHSMNRRAKLYEIVNQTNKIAYIEWLRLGYSQEILLDVDEFSDVIKQFYEELELTTQSHNPNTHYPDSSIQELCDLKFYPVWSGSEKCILFTNTPYPKNDNGDLFTASRCVERVIIEAQHV